MDSKQYFISRLEPFIKSVDRPRILDLGCGKAMNFINILKKFPNLNYVGVEPNSADAKDARENLSEFKNVEIINALAYESNPGVVGSFDVCVSLSVLEHVKHLNLFVKNSVDSVKKGGLIVHRYDLGHALYPSSLKEKLQVAIGNLIPQILPESKFVNYVDSNKVEVLLERYGANVDKVTYHQMPNHKKFFKFFEQKSAEDVRLATQIFEWEFAISDRIHSMDKYVREELFPSVAVWATKK